MREHNLFAPKDYSLVGFDGLELNEYIYPRITTIKQPVEEIAKKSCIELFKMINNQKYSEIVTFDGDLYIGDTTSNLREENI